MKRIAWLMALLMALPVLFAPLGAHALNKKLTSRSFLDARQCLNLPNDAAIIRCAERYM